VGGRETVFEFVQVAAKTVMIAVVIVVAGLVSVRIWRADLDLRLIPGIKKAVKSSVDEKVSWLPAREPDALYQAGEIVARVSGAQVDATKSLVLFEEIYRSNRLNLADEFEFQKWRLRLTSVETMVMLDASAPEKGRILQVVACGIVGQRPPI